MVKHARVAETAYRFARELEARGVGKGERVPVLGGERAGAGGGFFGCALRSAVIVPLDVESDPEFVARAVRHQSRKLSPASDTSVNSRNDTTRKTM